MAFMTDIVFDEKTGRYELHFVNQQYDLLMYIAWSEERQDYVLDDGRTDEATAMQIAERSHSPPFSLSHFLDEARRELPLRDRARRELGRRD